MAYPTGETKETETASNFQPCLTLGDSTQSDDKGGRQNENLSTMTSVLTVPTIELRIPRNVLNMRTKRITRSIFASLNILCILRNDTFGRRDSKVMYQNEANTRNASSQFQNQFESTQ